MINLISSFNYDLCVVGANSALGREIIYQAISKDKKVLALTSSTNSIYEPYRGGGFNEQKRLIQNKIISDNLIIDNYWNNIQESYDNLIFCTSSKPFQKDYSDTLTKKFIQSIPNNCRSIVLISAYGVGNSLSNANIGIQIMDNLYLKDVYRAKNEQEVLIESCDDKIKKLIYRPKALSYGDTGFIKSVSRQDLAREILNDIEI